MPTALLHDDDAPPSLDGRAESTGAWQRRPSRTEDAFLLDSTRAWLEALPKGVRPIRAPAQFPRIVNELFQLWNEPVQLDRFFADKAFDSRAIRSGFPPIVREELLALHVHALKVRLLRSGKLPLRWREHRSLIAQRMQSVQGGVQPGP